MVALQGWKSHHSIELATWGDRNTESSNATERLEKNGLTYLPILNASEWCPGIAQFYSITFSLSRKKKDRTLSAWLSDSSPTDTTIKGSCLRTMQRSCSTDCVYMWWIVYDIIMTMYYTLYYLYIFCTVASLCIVIQCCASCKLQGERLYHWLNLLQ
jgi:hypothetical protein